MSKEWQVLGVKLSIVSYAWLSTYGEHDGRIFFASKRVRNLMSKLFQGGFRPEWMSDVHWHLTCVCLPCHRHIHSQCMDLKNSAC